MNQLYPIIRRIRRPLIPVDDAPPPAPAPTPATVESAPVELPPVEPLPVAVAIGPKPAQRKRHAKNDAQ